MNTYKFLEIRPSVQIFAQAMELRLRKFDKERGKRGWKHMDKLVLMDRVKEETEELYSIYDTQYQDQENRVRRILEECCDIANFCMMIFEAYL